jgi:hypothetical protein
MINPPFDTEAQPDVSRINANSIVSLALGILATASLCMGLLPVPFTAFLCIPTSLVLGSAAVGFGMVALNGMRKHNQNGRAAAWIGVLSGGMVLLCSVLVGVLLLSLFVLVQHAIPTPPLFERYF